MKKKEKYLLQLGGLGALLAAASVFFVSMFTLFYTDLLNFICLAALAAVMAGFALAILRSDAAHSYSRAGKALRVFAATAAYAAPSSLWALLLSAYISRLRRCLYILSRMS